jgi:hypothetical protein
MCNLGGPHLRLTETLGMEHINWDFNMLWSTLKLPWTYLLHYSPFLGFQYMVSPATLGPVVSQNVIVGACGKRLLASWQPGSPFPKNHKWLIHSWDQRLHDPSTSQRPYLLNTAAMGTKPSTQKSLGDIRSQNHIPVTHNWDRSSSELFSWNFLLPDKRTIPDRLLRRTFFQLLSSMYFSFTHFSIRIATFLEPCLSCLSLWVTCIWTGHHTCCVPSYWLWLNKKDAPCRFLIGTWVMSWETNIAARITNIMYRILQQFGLWFTQYLIRDRNQFTIW